MALKNKILKIIYPKANSEIVTAYAEKYNIDEDLIYAVIKAESNFKNDAISNKNALGLMQIMEETAIDVVNKYADIIDLNKEDIDTKEKILDVQNNINIGTKYLSVLLEKYQNIEIAVSAYNAGTGTVDGWIEKNIIKPDGTDIENVPYKETNNYVRKILNNYKMYKHLY
ncbi:MAG: lytic transglycosylase domain-containing protein [Clostridia bacterium]|nr:lytic transglycosylase domain-containing protein [Clostridia bacterium]